MQEKSYKYFNKFGFPQILNFKLNQPNKLKTPNSHLSRTRLDLTVLFTPLCNRDTCVYFVRPLHNFV
jgi:hypothetical protein